jgi:hypothetical protein
VIRATKATREMPERLAQKETQERLAQKATKEIKEIKVTKAIQAQAAAELLATSKKNGKEKSAITPRLPLPQAGGT